MRSLGPRGSGAATERLASTAAAQCGPISLRPKRERSTPDEELEKVTIENFQYKFLSQTSSTVSVLIPDIQYRSIKESNYYKSPLGRQHPHQNINKGK